MGEGRRNATIQVPVIYKISHQDYQPSPKLFNDIGLLKLASYSLNEEYNQCYKYCFYDFKGSIIVNDDSKYKSKKGKISLSSSENEKIKV